MLIRDSYKEVTATVYSEAFTRPRLTHDKLWSSRKLSQNSKSNSRSSPNLLCYAGLQNDLLILTSAPQDYTSSSRSASQMFSECLTSSRPLLQPECEQSFCQSGKSNVPDFSPLRRDCNQKMLCGWGISVQMAALIGVSIIESYEMLPFLYLLILLRYVLSSSLSYWIYCI